jgi:hypothetical protein
MRAVGLFMLLAGSLLLLWPVYDQLLPFIHIMRSDTQLYGGALLMGGIVALIIDRARSG